MKIFLKWFSLTIVIFRRVFFCAEMKISNGSTPEKTQENVIFIENSQPCAPIQQTHTMVTENSPLKDSETFHPSTVQKNIVTKELIFTPPHEKESDVITMEKDCLPNTRSEVLQSQIYTLPNKNNIEDLEQIAQQGHKAMIIEDKARNEIILERVDYVETVGDELFIHFKELNYEPISVPESYDYFDVLSFIDKSIVFIQQFLKTLSGNNMTKILEIRQNIFEKIFKKREKFPELLKSVEELNKSKKKELQNSTKYDFVEDGLKSIKNHKNFLDDQLTRYVNFKYQDYQKAITMKIQKLICLQDYLKKVRAKICPLCKEEIEKNAELFKTTFKNTVSGVYTSLKECHEKEKNILNFFFENLNENLKNTERCDEELRSFECILKENEISGTE